MTGNWRIPNYVDSQLNKLGFSRLSLLAWLRAERTGEDRPWRAWPSRRTPTKPKVHCKRPALMPAWFIQIHLFFNKIDRLKEWENIKILEIIIGSYAET